MRYQRQKQKIKMSITETQLNRRKKKNLQRDARRNGSVNLEDANKELVPV